MIPVVCADGETRSYASHIFPIRDPHGELGRRLRGMEPSARA